jgi:Uma2 family endonuclease
MSSIKHLITVADLDDYPDDDGNRYELIEGELLVSRAPGIPHQLVLQNLQVSLVNYLSTHPIGRIVPSAGAIFSDFDAVIPDLVFVRNDRWNQIVANNRFVAAPDLVLEILSPGTENRRRDLELKKDLYSKYGVQEYWVVDQENRSVAVYQLKQGTLEESSVLRGDDAIQSVVLPDLRLKVSTIFKL